MQFRFKEIKIDKVTHSSGVFSGENLQVNWNCSKKLNEGFGTFQGSHNSSSNSKHTVRNHVSYSKN